jgi:phosphoribosyl 1,2-cyclic phosphodiesterase
MSNFEAPFQVLFLGSGVSTAIPTIRHVLDFNEPGTYQCPVCLDAVSTPRSKNKRNNVSIAVIFGEGNTKKCIMVDAGKTMRDACISQLPKFKVKQVNALLITHGHADAMLGLDDIRDLQQSERIKVPDPVDPNVSVYGFRILSGPMPIYMTEDTCDVVRNVFPYLTNPPKYLDEANNVIERRVALINLQPIPDRSSLRIEGMSVECFPTYHGGTYVSLGFTFGAPGQFVYISDVKIIPEESMAFLKSLPRIKTFVLDCLDHNGIWSHLGLHEAISICKEINPETVYFTGMCCSLGLHDEVEAELRSMGITNIFLAYDGLVLDV